MTWADGAHWSKDFVEHLRTVHFALILAASVLIVTGISTESTRYNTALTQIQQIARLEKQWPGVPTKLYERAMLDAKLDTEWGSTIYIALPPDLYRGSVISMPMDVPKKSVLGDGMPEFRGLEFHPEMNSLSEFVDVWDALHSKQVTVALPKAPTDKSSCDLSVRLDRLDGTFQVTNENDPSSLEKSKPPEYCRLEVDKLVALVSPDYPVYPMTYKIGTTYGSLDDFIDNDSIPPDAPPVTRLYATLTLPLQRVSPAIRKSAKQVVVDVEIGIESSTKIIDESYFRKVYFSDWKTGNFTTAFPELNSMGLRGSSVGIDDEVHRLESKAESVQKDITLLGFTIPASEVSRWGVLVLLSIQIYFWLHLHELAGKIDPDAEGWNVAWIGMYRSRTADVMAFVTCFLLPVAASVVLASRIATTTYGYRTALIIVSIAIVIASTVLGFKSFFRLSQLKRRNPDPTQESILVPDDLESGIEKSTATTEETSR